MQTRETEASAPRRLSGAELHTTGGTICMQLGIAEIGAARWAAERALSQEVAPRLHSPLQVSSRKAEASSSRRQGGPIGPGKERAISGQ